MVTAVQVHQAFSTKRKMLRNSLQPHYSLFQIEHALSVNGLDAQLRPQQLSFDNYVSLYRSLHGHSLHDKH